MEFTTLVAKCGYFQVDIDESDRDTLTFPSHHVLYSFTGMTFGLNNAPDPLQIATDISFIDVEMVILIDILWRYSRIFEKRL